MSVLKKGITKDNFHKYIDDILTENEKRHYEFISPYNQITGEGSPIKRFEFKFSPTEKVMLPQPMSVRTDIGTIMKFGDLRTFCRETTDTPKEADLAYKALKESIQRTRLVYDFEFWAITCCKIQDKVTKQPIPFRLRVPQRILLKRLEEMRTGGLPIRVIICKARQWGGSTLVQLWMSWIQLFIKENWHSAIIADVENQAKNIRAMYTRMAEKHPKEIQQVEFSPFEGGQKAKIIKSRGCIIDIGSAQQPDSLRSSDLSMLHCSEVGLWKDTQKKTAKDLIQTLRAMIVDVPYTAIILESTAKGVGNFFHKEWQKAERGETNYEPVFIPWFKIEIYHAVKIKQKATYINLMNNFTDYHWWLWEKGATLEAIKWYIKQSRDYDSFQMKSEFPSTAEEAFQSTGRRAFPLSYVLNARKSNRNPEYVGDLYADSRKGKKALKNVRFEIVEQGPLKIWAKPAKIKNIKNRYAAFADIGGTTDKADWSVVRIIDRAPMVAGAKPKMVATWRGHLDQDLFAWKAAQLAKYYHNALLAIEVNSLRSKTIEEDEGNHAMTVLDEISPYYDNLFYRTDPQKVAEGVPVDYGFHTNRKTKPMLVDMLKSSMRDDLYIEYDDIACDEADTYEIKEDGTYGAKDGCHDDVVMTSAGVLWLCFSYMDEPRVYEPGKGKSRKIINEASF